MSWPLFILVFFSLLWSPLSALAASESLGEVEVDGQLLPLPSLGENGSNQTSPEGMGAEDQAEVVAPAREPIDREALLEKRRQKRLEQRTVSPSESALETEPVAEPLEVIPGSLPPPPTEDAPEPVHSAAYTLRDGPLSPTGMATSGIALVSILASSFATLYRKWFSAITASC